MSRFTSRLLLLGTCALVVWSAVFAVAMVSQLADAADRVHAGAGQPMFWSLLPLLAAARWRTALNFGVTYAVLTALGMLDPDALGLPWLHVVSALAVGVTMMLPCFITGAYTFTTTSASAFICAMRRMRVPEAVVIPCVVVIRFFPTIAEDYRQIRNAMALRGIASGGWGLVRHPAQSLEYILIPLLMNATNVAQDLSVAALTKGLGREGEHTSRTLIRMTVVDWLVMIVVTLPLALDIAGVI